MISTKQSDVIVILFKVHMIILFAFLLLHLQTSLAFVHVNSSLPVNDVGTQTRCTMIHMDWQSTVELEVNPEESSQLDRPISGSLTSTTATQAQTSNHTAILTALPIDKKPPLTNDFHIDRMLRMRMLIRECIIQSRCDSTTWKNSGLSHLVADSYDDIKEGYYSNKTKPKYVALLEITLSLFMELCPFKWQHSMESILHKANCDNITIFNIGRELVREKAVALRELLPKQFQETTLQDSNIQTQLNNLHDGCDTIWTQFLNPHANRLAETCKAKKPVPRTERVRVISDDQSQHRSNSRDSQSTPIIVSPQKKISFGARLDVDSPGRDTRDSRQTNDANLASLVVLKPISMEYQNMSDGNDQNQTAHAYAHGIPNSNSAKHDTNNPTIHPTEYPSEKPSEFPTEHPTLNPTVKQTRTVSGQLNTNGNISRLTSLPTSKPTTKPTRSPVRTQISQQKDDDSDMITVHWLWIPVYGLGCVVISVMLYSICLAKHNQRIKEATKSPRTPTDASFAQSFNTKQSADI